MNYYVISIAVVATLLSTSVSTRAQSLGDFLKSSAVKNAVASVTGGKPISVEALSGTWKYVTPSVRLKADNALKDVAGGVVSSEMEKTLDEYCTKAGITDGVFTYLFNPDGTFVCTIKEKALKGTYTLDAEKRTIEMKFGKGGKLSLVKMTGEVLLTDQTLSLLFNADKLLEFISKLSSLTSDSTVKTIANLAEQYDGIQLGFELKR